MAAKAKTLHDFRMAHDPELIVPTRIRDALAAIAKEGLDCWEYEVDFLKRSGLSTTQLAAFRDRFAAHIVEVPTSKSTNKRVYFGNAKVAAKLKGK